MQLGLDPMDRIVSLWPIARQAPCKVLAYQGCLAGMKHIPFAMWLCYDLGIMQQCHSSWR